MPQHSITVHQNMGPVFYYANPNIWVGDINENPVTPKNKQECYLWIKILNDGTEPAVGVTVTFFLCNPAAGIIWPPTAHGSGSVPTLNAGAEVKIRCSVPWIPETSTGAHKCIVGVVSCLDCPAPATTPGTQILGQNKQIAQHNFVIQPMMMSLNEGRTFSIQSPKTNGHVEIKREPLSTHQNLLEVRGINPNISEAPLGETLNIKDANTGKDYGSVMNFQAGDHHDLVAHVNTLSPQAGTAALYHVRQYENSELIGGVSHIILY